MIDYQTRAALGLARTPLHRLLLLMHRKLERYADLAENWNNGNEQINGEAWLIGCLAHQWRVVFDVGANVGKWSGMLLDRNPDSMIYALEPSPSTYETLKVNFANQPRVKPFRVGLSDAHGSAPFHDYGDNSVLSSFVSRSKSIGMEPLRVIDTPMTTFDGFCRDQKVKEVDFVKLDTEGYEMAALRGMTQALRERSVAMIQFEYGGTWLDTGETLAEANQLLLDHGYSLYKLRPASLEKVHYDCRRYECFKYSNFVALATPGLAQRWNIPIWPS